LAAPSFGITVAGLIGGYVGGRLIRRHRLKPAPLAATRGQEAENAMGAGSVVGAVIRNLDDRYRFARIAQPAVDAVGRVALYLFIVVALITLRRWELAHLALPLLVMLAAQVVFCCVMCVTLAFWVMGGG
jgi:ESS family glutamate:Na+ symporter